MPKPTTSLPNINYGIYYHKVLPVMNKDESVTVAFTGNVIFTSCSLYNDIQKDEEK